MEESPIIEVSGLTKRYAHKIAVNSISFTVRRGEIFGILGPNGAGKTSTLEMMEAMRPIDEGRVQIDGIDVAKRPNKIKALIGVQLQDSAFYDKSTLSEQLQMFAAFYGRRIDPLQLLGDVELADQAKKYPEKLSGGQKQRFSIATALVNEPKVLFLDEPTTGLDPQARRHMWDLIENIRSRNVTVVLTTHYMEEAERLCDRLAIMDDGHIIALDSPVNLVQNLLERGFKKDRFVEQANLEDVFIDLTGKELRE
ncbi:MAG: ABC transporter ATP-binding protein [Coriobacteriales bacterium]|jgi:ABC-2 type transport system ATP-binding protein|nr:ABC transporter ATP-binding protein [Coriobacteriales bacterium]